MADKKPDEEKGGFLSGAASVAKWGFKAFIWDTDDSLGANLVKAGLTVGSVALIPFSAGGSLAARGAITAGAVASKAPAVANILSKTGLVAAKTVAKEGAELAAKTAAKTVAKEGAEAAAKTGAKVAQEAAEAGVKKVRLTGANEEALSAMKAAKEAGEAARAGGQAVAKTAAPAEKAAVEAIEVAAEKSAKAATTAKTAADPAVKSVLDGKAKASLGERTKNAINRSVEDSNLATRLAMKPVAATAGAAVSNPVKTVIGVDLAANLVSAGINPENSDKSLAYNAGQKTIKDAAVIASTGVKILSYIPVIGAPIAEWAYSNAKPAASSLYEAAGDALDGSVDQLAQEMGYNGDVSQVKIPGASLPGKIAAASRNGRVERARQTAEEKIAALRENAGEAPGQSLTDKAHTLKDAAEEKLLDGLNLSTMMSDPQAAWDKVKQAADKNPQLKKLVEIGEQHPYMKYGIMAGMAYGALTNEGNRLGGAIKGAMLFGILGDLIGALFGQKSFILDKIKEIRNSNSAVPGFETPRPSTYAAPSSRQQSPGVDGPGIVSDAKPKEDFGKKTAVQPAPVVIATAPGAQQQPGSDARKRFDTYEMQRSPMGGNTPALTPMPSLGG